MSEASRFQRGGTSAVITETAPARRAARDMRASERGPHAHGFGLMRRFGQPRRAAHHPQRVAAFPPSLRSAKSRVGLCQAAVHARRQATMRARPQMGRTATSEVRAWPAGCREPRAAPRRQRRGAPHECTEPARSSAKRLAELTNDSAVAAALQRPRPAGGRLSESASLRWTVQRAGARRPAQLRLHMRRPDARRGMG